MSKTLLMACAAIRVTITRVTKGREYVYSLLFFAHKRGDDLKSYAWCFNKTLICIGVSVVNHKPLNMAHGFDTIYLYQNINPSINQKINPNTRATL